MARAVAGRAGQEADRPDDGRLSTVRYTVRAVRQIDALHGHYLARGRVEASVALDRALTEAERIITKVPERGLLAPRPYPGLAAPGERWVLAGAYWVAYRLGDPRVVLGVFYDRADIPGRY